MLVDEPLHVARHRYCCQLQARHAANLPAWRAANDDSTWQGVQPVSWLLRTEPAEGYVTTAEAVAR
jgi:hypothetical protein